MKNKAKLIALLTEAHGILSDELGNDVEVDDVDLEYMFQMLEGMVDELEASENQDSVLPFRIFEYKKDKNLTLKPK